MTSIVRCWLVCLLLVTAHNVGASPPSPQAPFLVEPLPALPTDSSFQQRLKIKRLPMNHGYGRGAWILLYDGQQKPSKAIGWATVVESQGNELLAMVESLPSKATDLTLRAGPMPDRVRVGKTLGVILPQ